MPSIWPAGLLPAPARPYASVSGSKIFTQFPAGKRRFAVDLAGRFAPRSPLGLMPLRFGEQNLHTIPGRKAQVCRRFGRPVCSPLPASPCSSVPGSKIFTQFPRPHLGPADFSKARFAPRCPLALVLPFRGAKSSHNFRAPPGAGRFFQGAVCSPLPASPCFFLMGRRPSRSTPRITLCPAASPLRWFAPRCPLALVLPFRGAKSSHNFRAPTWGRPTFPRRGLLPAPR